MKHWLFLAIAIVGEVVATSALKSSEEFTKLIPSLVVAVGYSVAFYFLSLSLKSIPVGIAYAVWTGLGVVLVAAILWIFYGQKLDLGAFVGMSLIVSGVVVLNLFSKVSVPPAQRVACWVGPSQRRLVAVKISPPDLLPLVPGCTVSPFPARTPPSIPHNRGPRNGHR